MAYYTGSVNSYADLLAAIHSACQANGWSLSNGVLSKGSAFVKLQLATAASTNGIVIQGGTGNVGGTLTNPSPASPRLGRPSTASSHWQAEVWPATYHIHINEQPDEVFVVMNFNVQYHYYLAFGISSVSGMTGTGLWCSATTRTAALNYTSSTPGGVVIGPESGENGYYFGTCAPFWATNAVPALYASDIVHTHAGAGWCSFDGLTNSLLGISAMAPLITRSPNAWNAEAVLFPIKNYQKSDAGKVRLVLDMAHARYVRLNNLTPGEIITLGSDRWKVYPFYCKNAAQPNAGYGFQHTGTLGWAIRYDGA